MKLRADGEAYRTLKREQKRQLEGLELIPSENYVSEAVLEAMGSVLTNKYSEGYPGHRYYGGNQIIDEAENLAISRAQKLFKTNYHVNVQPYSGSPANIAVLVGLCNLGDKIMGMSLAGGGHLTHGHKTNFTGRAFNFVQYGLDKEKELLDYKIIEEMAIEEKPKMIICGATAYSREIDFKKFAKIAKKAKAILMADISHIAGLIAAGIHQSPFNYADVVTSTTHKTLRGPRGAIIFCRDKYAKDIDKAVFPGLQGGPHDHITLAKAVAFGEALKPSFKKYARQIVKNAVVLAKELKKYDFRIVSGGTDNHLMLVDLQDKNITGKQAEECLEKINISVNKNAIPGETRSYFDPSGIRVGTPACTTRGMKEKEMRLIAGFITRAIENHQSEKEISKVKKEVIEFAKKYKVPGVTN